MDNGSVIIVARTKIRGRDCYYDNSTLDWRYEDTNEICLCDNYTYRKNEKCPNCDCYPTKEGYDACLGHIEGANAVCCGHGVEPGYISMKDGRRFILIDHKKLKSNEEYLKIINKYYK